MTQETTVVFITGASSGIGAALAQRYAKLGYHLVLTARRLDHLTEVAKTCQSINPHCHVLPFTCDVTQPKDLNRAVAQATHEWGKLDVVIANAGFGVSGLVEKLSVEDFRRQFETNVYGVLNTVYATLADLKKSKGRLAIMGSVYSYVSHGYLAPYCMSKHAVKALSEALLSELKPSGVSTTLICPGIVESNIRKVDNVGTFHAEAQDPTPHWLQYPVDKAAAQMVRAIHKRKSEVIITGHGKLAHFIQRHFPALSLWMGFKAMGMLQKRHH